MLDLMNGATFAQGHPFETYRRMRDETPVLRMEPEGAPAYHVLTRYADIHAASHDTARFSSAAGFRLPTARRMQLRPAVLSAMARVMLVMDGAEHTAFRRLLLPSFSPQRLRAIEAEVERKTAEMLDAMGGRSEAEFVQEIAAVVPIHVLCTLLGIPEQDRSKVFDWTNLMVGGDDPEYSADAINAAFEQVFDYGAWLLGEKRREPTDDLMSVVAWAETHDVDLDQPARDGFCATLIAAGNETTRNAFSGALLALDAFPDQKARLAADPDLTANAVEELLRFVSPVIHMMRVAREDVEIGGQRIAAGERIAMLYGAANRDPDAFPDPDRLDFDRDNAKRHLAFGTGIHHCIGGRLAALELRILLRALLARFPDLRPSGPPEYLLSNFVCGIKRLPVVLQ